jgi:diguanylate cyclase (GGDEF)-like protein/PAS domain S-box-containing protein
MDHDQVSTSGLNALSLADPVHQALLESRKRWRDLVSLSADLCFETDPEGTLIFVAPDPALGWPVSALLGRRAEHLLVPSAAPSHFNPFQPAVPFRRRRAWLRRRDGSHACFAFAATPMLDSEGRLVGTRGMAEDVTDQEEAEALLAATLRRSKALDHILWGMRQEVLAPRMMQVALDSLVTAIGLEGAAVMDLPQGGSQPRILHQTANSPLPVVPTAGQLLERAGAEPRSATTEEGRIVLMCPCRRSRGETTGLFTWRAPQGRAMDKDDLALCASASAMIRIILEHDHVQQELALQARTDPLTSLLNRRAFLHEVGKRIDRLERDGLPGTLLFIDLDHFKVVNDCHGHEAGDAALCRVARLLRATVRPADLIARFGGDEFAVWLDGADELAAAERAEALRVDGPFALSHHDDRLQVKMTLSIGIATRWPGRNEDIELLIQRADQAMYKVKRAGRGHWRLHRPEDE